MYKKIKAILCFLLCSNICFSQQLNSSKIELTEDNQRILAEKGFIKCLSVEKDRLSRQKFPNRGTSEDFEKMLAPLVDRYKSRVANGYRLSVITIPVVFHIITDGTGAENVSEASIQAQIEQLNIDYRNLAGSVDPVAADIEVEFCLATLDTSNSEMAEPGINRVTTYGGGPFGDTYIDNTIKPATIWSPTEYMNIWSVDIVGLLGYAQFPDSSGLAGFNSNEGPANTDGIVVAYSTIGSVAMPNSNAFFNLGRTLTHEVGHWLGLKHIWGDGDCSQDDFCDDTPPAESSNFNCDANFSCGTDDMIENYMDYTIDRCLNIFTADQKARIRTVLSTSPRRSELTNSNKCDLTTPVISFENNENMLTVYPNPSKGYVSISINSISNSNVDINLKSIRGREVFNGTYKSQEPSFTTNFDFRDYPSGMYLLTVKSGLKFTTKKIILN